MTTDLLRQITIGTAVIVLTVGLLAGPAPAGAQAAKDTGKRLFGRWGMGAKVCTSKDFASRPRFRVKRTAGTERPRHLILDDFLPEVGNQGESYSCVGWSTAYYCFTYAVAKQRKLTPEQRQSPNFHFSPAFVYNQINDGKDEGGSIPDAFAILEKQGCATLAEMPYSAEKFKIQPDETAKAKAQPYHARWIGRLFKGTEHGEPANPEMLKTWLAEARRPFVLSMRIMADFPKGKTSEDFVYDTSLPPDEMEGRHAIAIVGYDEEKHAFRMVNSWGPDWGDKGFLWLSDQFIVNYTREGWAQYPGGPIARPVLRGAAQMSPSIWIEPAPGAAK